MRAFLLSVCLMSMCICSAQYYNESDSYANDTYVETFADLPSVRTVSGGTKLKTTYSDNVPMEMQGAFDYACKIWEEILPTNYSSCGLCIYKRFRQFKNAIQSRE